MMVLLFEVAGRPHALPCTGVVEVIARVSVTPVTGAPHGTTGVFVYRGRAVPLVDLHLLLEGSPCPSRLSNRIIVMELTTPTTRLVGALVERITDVQRVGAAPTSPGTAITPSASAQLGPLVQWVEPSSLEAPSALPAHAVWSDR